VKARYVKYRHHTISSDNLAISDFRIFGIGGGKRPNKPSNFKVKRDDDKRNATITWSKVKKATIID